jgi:hypothetical protein
LVHGDRPGISRLATECAALGRAVDRFCSQGAAALSGSAGPASLLKTNAFTELWFFSFHGTDERILTVAMPSHCRPNVSGRHVSQVRILDPHLFKSVLFNV